MLDRLRLVRGGALRFDFTNQIGQTLLRVQFSKNIGLFEGDVQVCWHSGLRPQGLNSFVVTALLILINIPVLDRGIIHLS